MRDRAHTPPANVAERPKDTMATQVLDIARSSVVYGVGNVLTKVVAFVLIPLYTRYLTPQDYGIITILILFEQFVSVIANLGVGSATYRFIPATDKREDKGRIVFSGFVLSGIANIVLCFVLYQNADKLAAWLVGMSEANTLYFRLTVLVVFLNTFKPLVISVLQAERKAIPFSILMLLNFTLLLLFNIANVAYLKKGVLGVVESNLWTAGIFFVVAIVYVLSRYRRTFCGKTLRKMVAFGVPLIPAGLAALVLTMADRYLLKELATMEDVGIYSIAYKFGMIMNMLLVVPFRRAWEPLMYSVERSPEAKMIYSNMLTYFVFVASFFWLGLSGFAKDIMAVATTEDYVVGYKIIPVVCLAYLLLGVSSIVACGVSIKNKTTHISLTVGLGAGLNVALNYVLIPSYGIMGASIATALSYLAIALTTYLESQRYFPIRYDFTRISKIATTSVAIYVLTLFLPVGNAGLSVAFRCLLLMSYPFLLYVLRFFRETEIQSFRKLLFGKRNRSAARERLAPEDR